MKFIIDRFEGEFAVCETEDESFIDIPISELYNNAKEGDHILSENGVYMHDKISEEKARKINFELQNSLYDED